MTETADRDAAKPGRSRLSRMTIATCRIVVIGYATVLITLVLMETRMVYPGAYLDSETGQQIDPRGGKIVSVDYTTADGVSLRGRLLDRPGSKNTLLFFHGNASKAEWLDGWASRLSDAFDATVMVAEYRGFGGPGPTPCEKGLVADSIAARDFLCELQSIEPTQLILYGRSLGGGCAVAVAASGGAKALVLERTFDRMVDVAAGRYPFVPVHWLMRNEYDSVSALANFRGPLIQLHGTPDRSIPIQHAINLHRSADCWPKRWIEVPGLGHNDRLSSGHLSEMAEWIDELQ